MQTTSITSMQVNEKNKEEQKAQHEIWGIMELVKNWERYQELMFREWPPDTYRITKEAAGNPLETRLIEICVSTLRRKVTRTKG